jgi:hypothetical protein
VIVIAWKTDDFEVVGTARVDLGERHKTRPIVVAKAVMWSRKDSDKDLASAEAYAKNPPPTTYPTYDYRVFVYPATERDPLERARRDVLRDPPKMFFAAIYDGGVYGFGDSASNALSFAVQVIAKNKRFKGIPADLLTVTTISAGQIENFQNWGDPIPRAGWGYR